MKRIIILSMIASAIFISSCNEDTINLNPVVDTEAIYFQNEAQMDAAVFGIYQKVCFFYSSRSVTPCIQAVSMLPSDDLCIAANNALANFSSLSAENSLLASYYQYAYQLIARANTVLQKIEMNGDFAYRSKPEQKNWNIGEALFLRAYMYLNLWNVFGTAPLATERVMNLDNAYLSNSTGTQLLDQAIIDLEEAAKLLPDSWPAAHKGRLVRNAAFGLRGKCLVFRGTVNKTNADFLAAIADFNAISGVSLTSTYAENFEITSENNEESLYEYQANDNTNDTNPNQPLGNDAYAVIGEIGHYTGMFDRRPSGNNGYFSATSLIKNAYDDGDPRQLYNINMEANTPSNAPVNVMKYIRNTAYAKGADASGVSINNPRTFRYADVLLLKAEAIVRSGGSLSDATGLINQIRARARNSAEGGAPSAVPADRDVSETDRNTVLEWVFQERRLELAFEEGHRWWDLRRRHIAGEIDLKTHDFGSIDLGFKFEDYNVNFPFPSREVVDNPNMNQNVGY